MIAKSLLDNEAFKTTMQDIENHYTNMWKDSSALDSEAREKLYLTIQILKKIKTEIAGYYEDYIVINNNNKLDLNIKRK